MEVKLTEQEVELFELLLASLKHKSASTVIRVAGGWVRDKLLQQQSVDIDVALDDQSGLEFATSVNEYLTHRGLATRTIAVIQANPDQSKHLETANLRVLGYEIDCVNLRAETYTDTRIPEIRKGTALEDALRRDFTINALFYNLNTKKVEDLTERGVPDLHEGVVRTPISAHITFRDDPLRVLRAVRFASRLQFKLDAELAEAASSAEVRAAIHDKVSRERIYKECEGCMTKENSRPYLAFTLIDRLHLLDVVLPLQRVLASHTLTPDGAAAVGADAGRFVSRWLAQAMRVMYGVNLLVSLRQQSSTGADTWQAVRIEGSDGDYGLVVSAAAQATPKYGTSAKALYWASLTAYLGKLQVLEKGKPVPLIPVLLREGLKMENITMKSVQTIAEGAPLMTALAGAGPGVTIDEAGTVLRSCKELWRDCILLACATELEDRRAHHGDQSDGPHSGEKRHLPDESDSTAAVAAAGGAVHVNAQVFFNKQFSHEEMEILRKYAALEDRIVSMGLDGVWLLKPLLNGGDMMKELQLPKGPMVGKLMEEQTKWQIRNPGSTDRAACLAYLRSIVSNVSVSV